MQGRLRNEPLEVEIATSCAHCGEAMHITVDRDFHWRARDGNPHLFLPQIDWPNFHGPHIIDDY